jgi:hypothetical protein
LDAHHEHFPLSKREGGLVAVDNAILAHRLCNRIDYSISVGRSYARDLERIRNAREEATRRNNVQIGNTEGGEIPTVVATVEADSESDAKKVYRKQEGLGQFPRDFFVEAIDESGEPVEEPLPWADAVGRCEPRASRQRSGVRGRVRAGVACPDHFVRLDEHRVFGRAGVVAVLVVKPVPLHPSLHSGAGRL